MAVTEFLKLQKPPFDSIPWDEAINGNMDILDGYISQFMSIPNFTGVWANSTAYVAGQNTLDSSNGIIYICSVTHTSAASPTTFAQDRVTNPTYWTPSVAGNPGSSYAPINSPAFTGTPTAPTPATTDSSTQIATTAYVQSQSIGKNYLHNPQFSIPQRGNGPFTASVYTADRWLAQVNTDTISWVIGTHNDTTRAQIGDEEATRYLSNTFTGSAGAPAYNYMSQRIENVRRLAGKTVTISFWAAAGSGTPKIGINILQSFGSGGSPSAAVRALATGNNVTISTTWTRYQTTIAIPSISGKTLGANGDDYTALELFFSSGATTNAIAGNVGVQSGVISLWGVQLEIGAHATPLEKIGPRTDLANCQRFYTLINFDIAMYGAAAVGVWQTIPHPTPMRTTPSANVAGGATVNVGGAVVTALNFTATRVGFTITALGGASYSGTLTLAADL